MGRLSSRMQPSAVDRNPRLRARLGWFPISELEVNHWYYGGDLVTLSSTKAAGWGDKDTPAANLAQATSGKQLTYVANGGPFGDSPHLLFSGASDTAITAATASDWTFLHNATNKFIAVSYVAAGGGSQVIVDTCNWDVDKNGISLVHVGGSQAIGLVISNANVAQYVSVQSANGTATDNVAHVLIFTMTAAGVYEVFVDGVSVLSGTWANTPAAGAAAFPLNIGGRANTTSFDFFGKVGEIVSGAVVPSASLRTKLTNFMNFTARETA